MKVRWTAVFIGFLVDFLISQLVGLFGSPTFNIAPDLSVPADLIVLTLLVLATGVGGYVAGRMAEERRPLHGLLVGVVGILLNQLALLAAEQPFPRVFVVSSAVGCLVGAIGGALSRYPRGGPRWPWQ
jgi:putative membrane protein (TIGR04086 family)